MIKSLSTPSGAGDGNHLASRLQKPDKHTYTLAKSGFVWNFDRQRLGASLTTARRLQVPGPKCLQLAVSPAKPDGDRNLEMSPDLCSRHHHEAGAIDRNGKMVEAAPDGEGLEKRKGNTGWPSNGVE